MPDGDACKGRAQAALALVLALLTISCSVGENGADVAAPPAVESTAKAPEAQTPEAQTPESQTPVAAASDDLLGPLRESVGVDPSGGDSCESSVADAQGLDLIIFMDPGADEAWIDAMEIRLTNLDQVARYFYWTKAASFAEFQEMFRDEERIRNAVTVEDMPTNFRIMLFDTGDTDEIGDSLESMPGVFEIIRRGNCHQIPLEFVDRSRCDILPATGVIVFIRPESSDEAIEDLRGFIESNDEIGRIGFINQAKAFAEINAIDPKSGLVLSEVPPSLQFSLPLGRNRGNHLATYEAQQAVFSVFDASSRCS